MLISVKLYLEVVIKRKSHSWDVRTFLSIVWNVIMSKRDYLKANNSEYCNEPTKETLGAVFALVANK